jgi:hypothetical protein
MADFSTLKCAASEQRMRRRLASGGIPSRRADQPQRDSRKRSRASSIAR